MRSINEWNEEGRHSEKSLIMAGFTLIHCKAEIKITFEDDWDFSHHKGAEGLEYSVPVVSIHKFFCLFIYLYNII